MRFATEAEAEGFGVSRALEWVRSQCAQ